VGEQDGGSMAANQCGVRMKRTSAEATAHTGVTQSHQNAAEASDTVAWMAHPDGVPTIYGLM
jgi:hypothetical protein